MPRRPEVGRCERFGAGQCRLQTGLHCHGPSRMHLRVTGRMRDHAEPKEILEEAREEFRPVLLHTCGLRLKLRLLRAVRVVVGFEHEQEPPTTPVRRGRRLCRHDGTCSAPRRHHPSKSRPSWHPLRRTAPYGRQIVAEGVVVVAGPGLARASKPHGSSVPGPLGACCRLKTCTPTTWATASSPTR